MPWKPSRWQYVPGPTQRDARALLQQGRVEEATALLEAAWEALGDEQPWSFGALFNLIRATQGAAAAEARALAELERPDLAPRGQGLVAAQLAWSYLDIAPVGAWRWRAPGWREAEALRFAELGHRRAPEIPLTGAALAVVRAYQGALPDADKLARQVLKTSKSRAEWAYWRASMHVVCGMVAAGKGDGENARRELERARAIQPGCDVIAALEASLAVADVGGVEAFWAARPQAL